MRRTFPATLDEVPRVVSFVTDLAARAGMPSEKGVRLELAVEEWVANLCEHAYAGERGELAVEVRKDGERLLIEISDDGPAFDPTAAAEPDVTLGLEERTPGGLGLLLIRRMLDQVLYRREGGRNVVTMVMAGPQL